MQLCCRSDIFKIKNCGVRSCLQSVGYMPVKQHSGTWEFVSLFLLCSVMARGMPLCRPQEAASLSTGGGAGGSSPGSREGLPPPGPQC